MTIQNAKLLFTSSRPLSWVNTAFPFAAGYIYFTHTIDPLLIIGTFFFLIPYNLLMYGVNDVYDYESDMRNPRKGGIEGAVVAKQFHPLILSWAYLSPVPFVATLIFLAPSSAFVLLACLFFVLAYSIKGLRFKEIPVLDSITSSLHFVGPLLYALSCVHWPPEAWPIVGAFFLWGIASQSFGAIQDIIADRTAGVRSIATVWGARFTLYFALCNYIVASVIICALGGYGILVGVAAFAYAVNLLPYLHITDESAETTRPGWKRFLWINFIIGFIVTLCLITLSL